MSFLFRNSSIPHRPSSRPNPDRFNPPNGISTPSAPTPLMKTIPTSSCRRRAALALDQLCIRTNEPEWVSFATAIASSSEATLKTIATGPNNSS